MAPFRERCKSWLLSVWDHRTMAQGFERSMGEKARREMLRKPAKTKPARPAVRPEEDTLAYEMWLTREVEHGSVEDRGAAQGLLLRELQRRGPRKPSSDRMPRRKAST